MGIKATFFAEAETLRKIDIGTLSGHDVGIHGVEHEDLTLIQDANRKRAILKEASEAVKDAVGKSPECFRAPYMKADQETADMLRDFQIYADSSCYRTMSRTLDPILLRGGAWEMAVPVGRDAAGKKIAAYLWPMHEQKRVPEDYVKLASQMEKGVFVLATHTWHMVESRERGKMSGDEIERNISNVRKVLEGIVDSGIKPMTMTDVARLFDFLL
jgi:peptidoglycan/xylan/chitin deacetylase (PgdA/CDA1 family)